jgi:hypothetical protein
VGEWCRYNAYLVTVGLVATLSVYVSNDALLSQFASLARFVYDNWQSVCQLFYVELSFTL